MRLLREWTIELMATTRGFDGVPYVNSRWAFGERRALVTRAINGIGVRRRLGSRLKS